jgi:hypothetical protein
MTRILHFLIVCSVVRPPLWSSGQSSWLQIQRSGFDSQHYQVFWEVVGLERDPLSLVSTTEELLGRESSDFCLENEIKAVGDPLRWPRNTFYQQKSSLTSAKSGSRSVGIVRSGHGIFLCIWYLGLILRERSILRIYTRESFSSSDGYRRFILWE